MLVEIREPRANEISQIEGLYDLVTAELRKMYCPCPDNQQCETANHFRQLAAFHNRELLGVVQFCDLPESLFVRGLAVCPRQRRNGVARVMIEHLTMIARTQGKTSLELETIEETGNPFIFTALGFTVTTRIRATMVESIDSSCLRLVRMAMNITG